MLRRKLALLLTSLAIATYAASLFFPVFLCHGTTNWEGYGVLLMGWLGFIFLDPRWFLNIMFFYVTTQNLRSPSTRNEKQITYAAIMIVGALTALFLPAMSCGAGGAPSFSIGLATGGYLWVAAMIVGGVSVFIDLNAPNFTVDLAPFGRWTLRDKAAQRRSPPR